MNLKTIKKIYKNTISSYYQNKYRIKKGYEQNKQLYKTAERSQLSEDEKNRIKDKWGSLIKDITIGFPEYELYKAKNSFSENYVPYAYYLGYLIEYLNPYCYKETIGNKNFNLTLFKHLKKPISIVRNIDGLFLDEENNLITENVAKKNILHEKDPLLIKPTNHSGAGEGIKEIVNLNNKEIDNLLKLYQQNFVIQKKIKQSKALANLNESSVNTLRITTLIANNKVNVVSKTIRIGQKGSSTDNVALGGIMIGVDDNGFLNDYGYDKNLNQIKLHNGFKFGGYKIPNYDKVVKEVIKAHLEIPILKIVGWDMTLNEDNEPIFIEANVYRPGITIEQFCTGPIFGSNIDKVISEAIQFYHDKIPKIMPIY